jgi:two-component system, NtrC family, sensor histidine kinase AtoS
MSNAVTPRQPFSTAWRGKTPGMSEFNVLLNLFTQPVVLIDAHRGQVLSANSSLLKLTAFTQAEITSMELNQLLPELPPPPYYAFEVKPTALIRHNRDAVQVVTRSSPLDNTGQWQILELIPLTEYQMDQANEERQEKLLQAILELANLSQQPDAESAMKVAMRTGRDLVGASLFCIYHADVQSPQIIKAASFESETEPFFPYALPSINLIRLETPYLWLPGRKVISELHREARIANLSYLASVPLGQESAWFGLLVAGDGQQSPPEAILTLMQVVAVYLTATIQHFLYVSHLNQVIQNHDRTFAINSAISENAAEGIILLKPDLTIVEMNPAAELILGYASQEVIGSSIENILIGAETISAALKSAIQGIPTHNLGNISLHRRRGQPFAAHIQTIPVFENQDLASIVIFLSDVSENEQIRVRTQQLEQRAVLGEVTAIFAHEVRNPINNISTGLQLMQMNLPPEDPGQELIGRLQHDCSRLTHLMESVLSFSRPQEYKFEPTDLSALLKRMLDRWEPRMARVNIKPLFLPGADLPQVSGDPRALEQVFTNLISNAVQAMSSNGGTLAIKVELLKPAMEHPQVTVSITDNGPGIPDEIKDHIFEPFVTTNPQGTGLGLAITKRIVIAHKGSITVSSFPGGTTFQVQIPAITGENG